MGDGTDDISDTELAAEGEPVSFVGQVLIERDRLRRHLRDVGVALGVRWSDGETLVAAVRKMVQDRDAWKVVADTMEATRNELRDERDRLRAENARLDALVAVRRLEQIVERDRLYEACEQLRRFRPAIRIGDLDDHPELADAILGVVAILGAEEET